MMELITQESIEGLVAKFGFDEPGPYTQDWECEVSDAERYKEFLSFYEKGESLTDEEKFTLMMIVIESTNSAMKMLDVSEGYMIELKNILIENYTLHQSTLDDWADWEQEDLDQSHIITPFIRSIVEPKLKG